MKATIKMVNQTAAGIEVVFEYANEQAQTRSKVLPFRDDVKAADVKATIKGFLESKAVAPKLKQLREALVGDVIEV